MTILDYHFNSQYVKFKLLDARSNRVRISILGSKFSEKLKRKLDGISIIDEEHISQLIESSLPDTLDFAYVQYDVCSCVGLHYLIIDGRDNSILYQLVINIVDPTIDFSWLLD